MWATDPGSEGVESGWSSWLRSNWKDSGSDLTGETASPESYRGVTGVWVEEWDRKTRTESRGS